MRVQCVIASLSFQKRQGERLFSGDIGMAIIQGLKVPFFFSKEYGSLVEIICTVNPALKDSLFS